MAAAIFSFGSPVAAVETPLVSRESIVAALRHQERLVRSAACTFDVQLQPTKDEDVPRLRAVCKARGNEQDYQRYIYTTESALRRNCVVRWIGLGIKERSEAYATLADLAEGENRAIKVLAFDGQVIRSFSPQESQVLARIDSRSSADWDTATHLSIYSLLFAYHSRNYSDLLETSDNVEISAIKVDNEQGTRVVFVHPDFKYQSFDLAFDKRLRLRRRVNILQLKDFDREPRPYEIYEFTDYKVYDDESGERIDFPQKVTYHHIAGLDPATREPVEYMTEQITLQGTWFNRPVPDTLFAIELPKDAKIYDGLTGRGWIGGPPVVEADAPPRFAKRSLLMWFVVGNVFFISLLVIAVRFRRSRGLK
jgi:hypothetical protein